MENNQTQTSKDINQEIDELFAKQRKLQQFDHSYKFKKYWKAINIFSYVFVGIGFVLFLLSAIFFTISKDYDLIKILGMVFGFVTLGLLSVNWFLISFLNSPVKLYNRSTKKTDLLVKKQNKLMLVNKILFFCLTIIPTLMLVFSSNVFGLYPQTCLIIAYWSLVIFTLLAIAVIIINFYYQKTKKQILDYLLQII